MPEREQRQGSCIALDGVGVLLLGSSGSGKSDLALRLIQSGATLVADDVLHLSRSGHHLYASAPHALAGLLELHGAGIVRLPHVSDIPIALAVALVARDAVVRLPEPAQFDCLGVPIPLLSLHAFDGSTPAKIITVLEMLRAGNAFVTELKQSS